ncbi:MAG TPA: PRC-barrel domain-containing protein [archaeon]|jgi:sporulation protein YlmC with PRC-barrel domain|nr:PRC-barrel domain-containing protein [archaeon]
MRAEVSTLFGLNVYTDKGVYIGKVNDVVLEPNESKISGLAVGKVNKELFDVSSNGIILPFRWVIAVGDIILTRQISTKIMKKSGEEEKESD